MPDVSIAYVMDEDQGGDGRRWSEIDLAARKYAMRRRFLINV